MGSENRQAGMQVAVALAVDDAEHVTLQVTTVDSCVSSDPHFERPVHLKLKVDKAGRVHVTLEVYALHHGKHSWAKHQFKKLLNILTHKHHKKSKGGDTSSPSDKNAGVQSPATPQKTHFWKIGTFHKKTDTPTAQQAEPAQQAA